MSLVVHSTDLTNKFTVINFGDPNNGSRVGLIDNSKVKIFCHEGDNICEGGILVLPPHRNVRYLQPLRVSNVGVNYSSMQMMRLLLQHL